MAEQYKAARNAVKTMISLSEARSLIIRHAAPPASVHLPLSDCLDMVLTEDITAQHDQPWAALSAMDGYAIRLADGREGALLRVIGESRAGAAFGGALEQGQAVAISTGAAVPEGADHIVMVEETRRDDAADGDMVRITAAQSANGFIRRKGQDFSRGDVLLSKGQILSPAHIALAAASGAAGCLVTPRPSVAIITNGDELLNPGQPARHGFLYDSNGLSLAAQCRKWGADAQWLGRAGDDPDAVTALIKAATQHDLIIIAGGASVGKYDHVRASFAALGGELYFSKIKLRPGKPAWFGDVSGTPVIGLPGNPASAFVTAELLARPAIAQLTGRNIKAEFSLLPMELVGTLSANGGREAFLRGTAERSADGNMHVASASDQDSSLLRPLAAANILIHRPPHDGARGHGDIVNCYLLREIETQV